MAGKAGASSQATNPATDQVAILNHRLSRLRDVSRDLIGATTADEVVGVVMQLVDTPDPAISRGLWLTDTRHEELRLADSVGFTDDAVGRFTTIPVDADLPGAIACRERRTVISSSRRESEQTWSDLQGVQRSAECFVAIPLLLEDGCLGVLGLGYASEPSSEDVEFLEAIAGQCAQALARVRLSERERRRRLEMEFLADLTEKALSAKDHDELMRHVTSAAVPMLGDWCTLTFLPTDGGEAHVAVAHVDPAKVLWAQELVERFPYDPNSNAGVAAVIRSGTTQFIPDVTRAFVDETLASADWIDPADALPLLDELHLTSVITVPLRTKRRTVGAMRFVSAESGRHYDDEDVDLAEAVAGRLAEPLDNVWVTDQVRHLSISLQRALLPPRIPTIDGVEIAVGYWPAGNTEVGGDFYDVFALGDDTWAITIGDACGKGPDAAALTTIARHTARAAARHGQRHAMVMEWVNEAVLKSDRDLFLTACFATLERRSGRWQLRFTSAGHPLPIVLSCGIAETVGQTGKLLGVFDSVKTPTIERELAPGDAVVFYTDGLTDLPPPYGLEPDEFAEMIAPYQVGNNAHDILGRIRDLITRRVPEAHRSDDVALAIIRIND